MIAAMRTLALVLALAFATSAAADPKPDVKQLTADRTEIVVNGVDLARKMFDSGRGTIDEVHHWALRLLDAKLDGAKGKAIATALAEHADRMHDLDAAVEKGVQAGLRSSLDRLASRYFAIEADLWVARGKK